MQTEFILYDVADNIAAFRRWNPEEEDVEALVAGIFLSMWEARPVNWLRGDLCTNDFLKRNDSR